jgi:hypothetical protein
MPYLHPISKADRLNRIKNGSIMTALKTFCKAGFLHPDIKWRHLGLWRENIVLLDLGMLNKEDDDGKRLSWCDESITTLRDRAGMLGNGNETPTMNTTKGRAVE